LDPCYPWTNDSKIEHKSLSPHANPTAPVRTTLSDSGRLVQQPLPRFNGHGRHARPPAALRYCMSISIILLANVPDPVAATFHCEALPHAVLLQRGAQLCSLSLPRLRRRSPWLRSDARPLGPTRWRRAAKQKSLTITYLLLQSHSRADRVTSNEPTWRPPLRPL
jgi:hypothetical protein